MRTLQSELVEFIIFNCRNLKTTKIWYCMVRFDSVPENASLVLQWPCVKILANTL